jgi:biopolymer transport protein ExbB/TolQ
MTDPVTIILSALVVAMALGQIYLIFAIRRLRDRLRTREDQSLRQRDDFAALCKASVGAGDHLLRLEQHVRRLTERQDQIEMRTAGERPYTQAIQMVQRGANVTELVSRCGLTRGEAELIAMLHGDGRQTGTAGG